MEASVHLLQKKFRRERLGSRTSCSPQKLAQTSPAFRGGDITETPPANRRMHFSKKSAQSLNSSFMHSYVTPEAKRCSEPRSMRIQSRKVRIIAAIVAFVLIAIAGVFAWNRWISPWLYPPSPLVVTPSIALESLSSKNLFFSNEARPWLLKLRPDLLHADDMNTDSARSRSIRQANVNPKLFRQLDRQLRFDTVLLLGDPSGYQRLLDHLTEAEPSRRDFQLVYLDHWTYVFRRGDPKRWEVADVEAVRKKIGGGSPGDRAAFLAKTAAKLIAIREYGTAKKWLEEALSLDGDSVDALAGMANFQITLGKWKEAEAFADRALEKEPDFVPALAARVVIQRATKHFLDALRTSIRLNELIPENPIRLWQHAETAREARKRGEQVKALERLIALAEEEERPAGTYWFYLGDAHIYLATEDATHVPKAAECFRKALADATLSSEHRKFAEERMATIRERTGLK
jgi:tetratricopeptide (TPR) repeat protein